MKLSELTKNLTDVTVSNIRDVNITDIVTDSRKATRGALFVCLKGENENGHKHILNALINGAVAIAVEDGEDFSLPPLSKTAVWLTCKSTRRTAAELYDAWYGHPSKKLKVIGITGTNGKTSTAFILKSIFEGALYKCGIIGTVECRSGEYKLSADPDSPLAHMTTPDPRELYRTLAFMAADRVDYVFMEVSSHALKLQKPCAIEFDTAIFTNLTPEHQDFHRTMEDYRDSKSKLFSMSRYALINADDPCAEYMMDAAAGKVLTYSTAGNDADFSALEIEAGQRGINYTLNSKNTIMKIRSPLKGLFNVDNTLAAVSCALMHGIAPSVIDGALISLGGVKGRMERIALDRRADFDAIIDYAHTPDALKNLLLSVREIYKNGERIILIFGCGGDRDREKRPIMGAVASSLADYVIITSDNSRGEAPNEIINEIMSGFDKTTEYIILPNRREAIECAVRTAKKGDVVILAGKGHEKYEIDAEGSHPFDECEIFKTAVKKAFGKG